MHVTFGLRNLLLTFSGQLVLRPTLCPCKKLVGLPIGLGSSILNFGLSLLRPTKLALGNKVFLSSIVCTFFFLIDEQ
jgi:hypothetical protein